jgi:hypothetical protein
MIAKKLSTPELEAVYDLLSEAIDAVADDKRELFLAKLALVLANMLGSPGQVAAAVKAAAANLGPSPAD